MIWSPPVTTNTTADEQRVELAEDAAWMLVNGSTRLANEKPTSCRSARRRLHARPRRREREREREADHHLLDEQHDHPRPCRPGSARPREASGVSASASRARRGTSPARGAAATRRPARARTARHPREREREREELLRRDLREAATCPTGATSCGIWTKSWVVYDVMRSSIHGPRDHEHDGGHDDLRHERQRHLLDLRRRLEDRDDRGRRSGRRPGTAAPARSRAAWRSWPG